MAKFRSPRNGNNVVHRVELPSLNRAKARRRALLLANGTSSKAEPRGPGAAGEQQPGGGDASGPEQRRVVLQPVAPPRQEPAPVEPSVPRPAALRDSQARHQIQLLERRLVKMARLLEARDQESLSASVPMDEGVPSIYREVQGIEGRGKDVKKKHALMSKILEQNLKLRERVTSSSSTAR